MSRANASTQAVQIDSFGHELVGAAPTRYCSSLTTASLLLGEFRDQSALNLGTPKQVAERIVCKRVPLVLDNVRMALSHKGTPSLTI